MVTQLLCLQKAWGHTTHRGWARLLLDRARGLIQNLIIHGPAHRGANGAAMPTDEDDQDGHFFFNHPERGGLLRCPGARGHCYCCLDPIPVFLCPPQRRLASRPSHLPPTVSRSCLASPNATASAAAGSNQLLRRVRVT